jgi:membrane-associated phospholipid phosphatase
MAVSGRPVEWLLGGYAAVVALVAVARAPAYPPALGVAVGHGLIVVLMVLLARPGLGRLGRGVREVAPIVLLLALYAALDVVNAAGTRPTHDALVQGWEAALFGGQPSRDWWRAAPSQTWSAVLHAAYFAYYVIVPFPVALHLARGDRARARSAVLTIMAAFLACYLWFVFLPVAGPYYEFDRPDARLLDNAPARLVYGVLAGGSSFGAAFPSSHVAGTWAAVAATATGSPRWAAVLAVPAALLTVGVVYTQMHYAVDALAGVAVAALAVLVSRRLGRAAPLPAGRLRAARSTPGY